VKVGSKREGPTGPIADSIPEPDPDFEKTFVTNWLTLNKAHYYGTLVEMDPVEFPQLRKVGHYTVGAEYYSRGISSTPGWNGGYLKQEDIDKLPLKAWKGTIDSNFVTIQVRPRTSKNGKWPTRARTRNRTSARPAFAADSTCTAFVKHVPCSRPQHRSQLRRF